MYTAKDAAALRARLKAEGKSRAEIIQAMTAYCLGWPYVFGAYGQACTPVQRSQYAGYRQDHAAAIRGACLVLSGKAAACDGCEWNGTLIADCRGFTRLMLQWAGLSLYGGTVTAQWEYGPNWVKKGPIEEMPRGLVCCVFRPSHTGMYVGNDTARHCGGRKGRVVEEQLPGSPRWERYGIPAGLYTDLELREAGIIVDASKNIPTIRRGAEGDLVEELQAILNAKYGAELDIDGVFGAKTETAVKAFQKAHGLTVDGIVGPKTRAALGLGGLSPTTQRPDGPIPVSVGADTIRPLPDAMSDSAGGTVSQLPTSVESSTVSQTEMIALPLSDWQSIRAAVLAAYSVLQKYE